MRYLRPALIAEGVSDDRFLPFLLYRALEDICASEFADPVDVEPVTVLRQQQRPPNIPEIVDLVQANPDAFHLFFVHRDQGASAQRVDQEWIAPLRAAWVGSAGRLVPVVPVRETEAWVLADGNALRSALGVRWTDAEMQVPGRPRDVEAIADPKVPIERLARRRGRRIDDFLEEIAESVSLDVLRHVPSFAAVRERTVEALTGLGHRRQ